MLPERDPLQVVDAKANALRDILQYEDRLDRANRMSFGMVMMMKPPDGIVYVLLKLMEYVVSGFNTVKEEGMMEAVEDWIDPINAVIPDIIPVDTTAAVLEE